jgi:valyl-tRNA synthetase
LQLELPERYIVSRCHELAAAVTANLERLEIGEAGKSIYDFLWNELADWYLEISKTRLRSKDPQTRQMAADVLRYVWDTSLRLLHPFMPFITEVLWQNIPTSALERGESLMVSAWPAPVDAVDAHAVEMFSKMQSLVRSVRNARAEYNVDAVKKVDMVVKASDAVLAALQREGSALAMLARTNESIKFARLSELIAEEAPGRAVRLVIDKDLEVFLPQASLLDRDKELARIAKQAEKLKKDLETLKGRLSNASYRAKAPAALVLDVEKKTADLRSQLEALESARTALLATK